jgi:hypothetical protein
MGHKNCPIKVLKNPSCHHARKTGFLPEKQAILAKKVSGKAGFSCMGRKNPVFCLKVAT